MDFMSDQLFDGHRIRLLTIVDNHTRVSLAIHVSQRISRCDVVQVLERVSAMHKKPVESGFLRLSKMTCKILDLLRNGREMGSTSAK